MQLQKIQLSLDYVIKDDFYIAYTRFCKFHKLPVEQKETFGKILKQKYNYQDGRETKGERKTIWKGRRLIKWNNNDPLTGYIDIIK